MTHRAVAKQAGASLGAITHRFGSRDALLRAALLHAAALEVANLDRLALELQSHAFDTERWIDAMTGAVARDIARRPVMHLTRFELMLACARDPQLREPTRGWRDAHLRVAELGLRAAGSPTPAEHAQLLVGAMTGLMLKQLARPVANFGPDVLTPLVRDLVHGLTR